MDALTFIAKLVEHLAWPATAVVAALLLRHELRRLLGLIKKLKAGPIEAEFEREVIELRESVPLAPAPDPVAPALTAQKVSLAQLAEASPRSAILEAWRNVEAVTQRVAAQYQTSSIPVPSLELRKSGGAMRIIIRSELLSSDWIARYFELRELRNRAAHDHEFTPTVESAVAYIELASRLQSKLEAVAIGG